MLKNWILAARPRTLPAAIAPVALGSALAKHYFYPFGISPVFGANGSGYFQHGWHFLAVPALCCAGFALFGQIAANFANDYLDGRRGADATGRLGPTRAVSAGLITPRAMLLATLVALALAAGSGLGTLFSPGWALVYGGGCKLVIIGVVCLTGALAYTPVAYFGFGEVFALVYFGLVAVIGTYYVETVDWPPSPAIWAAATACGLLAANILLVNNIRDRATDEQAGKRTLVVRVGRQWAQRIYAINVFLVMFVTLLFFLVDLNLWLIPALAAAVPLGVFFIRGLHAIPEGDGPRFNHLLAQSAQFMALWSFLMALGIVLAER